MPAPNKLSNFGMEHKIASEKLLKDAEDYDLDLTRFNVDEDVVIKSEYFEKFKEGLNSNCIKAITDRNLDKNKQ
jgi:hypothetical protein